MTDPAFLRRTERGVTVELRAQPKARRTALGHSKGGALKAAVTAPAEDGKANTAVVALLAAEWRLPRSAFAVLRGAAARDKVFSISGEPAALADRIAEWVREHG
ncbi:MAG: DUF167 domain-containing protein [Reyranella sp.]|uniref:DUF167 domain-containing protein n=1 Tax=Reyranella sp. TaxID=1929291 RepID=UPI001214D193|nr:DUF167 domain-containing protein [Reyranella sp.]TAJ42425.1 MAG: DUF167 domain-containing protein [Reyranella sp.]